MDGMMDDGWWIMMMNDEEERENMEGDGGIMVGILVVFFDD